MTKELWNPGTLLKTSGYFWKTFALHTAVKLDIFTALGENEAGADDVSSSLKADRRAVGMLLNALAAMGLIKKTGDTYANTDASRSFRGRDRRTTRLDAGILGGCPYDLQ